MLSLVLIHLEFIPSGEPIMREQKKRASRRPNLDFLPQGRGIVGNVEKDMIGVIGGGHCCDYMVQRAVIYDDGDKLQDISRDETTILVVLVFVEESVLLDLLKKRDMPPVA